MKKRKEQILHYISKWEGDKEKQRFKFKVYPIALIWNTEESVCVCMYN